MENNIVKNICDEIIKYDKNKILLYFSIPNTEYFDTYVANLMIFTACKEAYRKYSPFSSRKNLRPETLLGMFNIDFKEILPEESEELEIKQYVLKFLSKLKDTMTKEYNRKDFICVAFRDSKDNSKVEFICENSEPVMRTLVESMFISTCDDSSVEISEIIVDENSKNFGCIKFRDCESFFALESDALPDIISNERFCPQLKELLKEFYKNINKLKKIEEDFNSKLDENSKLLLEFAEESEDEENDE